MDCQRREADRGGVDEVARQRQKRRDVCRDQLVGGTVTITVGRLADEAVAATTDADGDVVTRFLRAGGHSPATIEKVLRCLALERTEPERDGTVTAFVDASPGQQRIRTVAQLEALLLHD